MPDIPLEETEPVRRATAAAGLELVLLTTPTTPPERMGRIAALTEGFVYLVSVTGMRLHQCPQAQSLLVAVRIRWHVSPNVDLKRVA